MKEQKENYNFFKDFITENSEILGIDPEYDFFNENINFKNDLKSFQKLKRKIQNKPIYKADPTDFDRFLNILEGCHSVDSYGGEGKGDEYYTVYYFPNAGIFIKFKGYYQSYDGATYTNMYMVEPKEVTKYISAE